jgi:HK97 family phage portal protein
MPSVPAIKTQGDRVRIIDQGGERKGWLEKAWGLVVARLSLINTAGWETSATTSGEPVNTSTVLGLSSAWSCVNLIAGTLGTLPFEVWRNDPRTGHPTPASDHWLHQLIRTPNLEQTRIDFLEFLSTSVELRGNSYARKGNLLAGGSTVSLTPIHPDNCYVSRSRETGRLVYRVRTETGGVDTLGPEDIWHVRGFGGDPLGGMSVLQYGREAFGLAQALDRAAAATFRNGVKPSGVFMFDDWLTEPRRNQARQDVDAMKGTAAAGKPLILEGGVKWEALSFSPEEAQMLSSRSFSVEEVCRWFQVPPVLVGHTEKVSAWGTGIGEITLGWLRFGLRRRLRRFEASADQQLLTPADRAAGYFTRYNVEALLRADSKGRAAFYEIMTRAGVMTINECRRLEGLPPVPGGDVPRMQSQNVPIGAAIQSVPVLAGDGE